MMAWQHLNNQPQQLAQQQEDQGADDGWEAAPEPGEEVPVPPPVDHWGPPPNIVDISTSPERSFSEDPDDRKEGEDTDLVWGKD